MIRKFLIAAVLFACGAVIGGCTSGETAQQHWRRLMLTEDIQARSMIEDWDYFWLSERNSRLTQWNSRIGY